MSVRLSDWFAPRASLNRRIVLSVVVEADQRLRPYAFLEQSGLRRASGTDNHAVSVGRAL